MLIKCLRWFSIFASIHIFTKWILELEIYRDQFAYNIFIRTFTSFKYTKMRFKVQRFKITPITINKTKG